MKAKSNEVVCPRDRNDSVDSHMVMFLEGQRSVLIYIDAKLNQDTHKEESKVKD